jgi:hypothetical protein
VKIRTKNLLTFLFPVFYFHGDFEFKVKLVMMQLCNPVETSSRSGIVQGAMQSPPTQPITSLCAARFRSPFASPPESSEAMRSSRPCMALCLSLMLLAGLTGCGPASPDNVPNIGPNASMGGPGYRPEAQSTGRGEAIIPAITSVNETGSASGKGTVPGGDSPQAVPVLSSEPGHPVDGLVVPEWMVQKLHSRKVRVRLQALETWAQSAPLGSVDPLILAFEDPDERVRARAQQLIEQVWARTAEAGK